MLLVRAEVWYCDPVSVTPGMRVYSNLQSHNTSKILNRKDLYMYHPLNLREKNFLLGSTINFFLAVKHSQTWIIYRYVDLGMLKAYLEAKYTNYFHLHTVQPVLDVSLIDVESSELHSHQTTESWVMNSYTVAMVTTQACCSWHWDLSNWWDFQALQTTKESVWFVIVIHHFSLTMKQSSTS